MSDPTQRFSDRVENYVRYRPSYPPELVRCLRDRAGLDRNCSVADIGSGTGILTTLLLPVAGRVYAVEPNAAMRTAAEHALRSHSGFTSVTGTAESTTLAPASVDLVTAGQAFHWFDPRASRAEFARILKPGGRVALIWNERLTTATPFLTAYDRLLRTLSDDYNQVNHTRIDAAAIGGFFAPSAFDEFTFPNEQHFDWPGLIGRALSSSYVPNAGQPGHDAFMAELKRIFDEHAAGDRIAFQYATRLYLGQLAE
jgi:SAM-dependent methyltransferase